MFAVAGVDVEAPQRHKIYFKKKSVASRGNTNDMQTKTNDYQEVVRLLYNGASVGIESIDEVTYMSGPPALAPQ